MKERFLVMLDKSCNPDHLLERFQLAGINFVGPYSVEPYKGSYIFEYDPDVLPKRHNRPGQGRHRKPLLKPDGTPYTCGEIFKICGHRENDRIAVEVLKISVTTFYARKKAHTAAGEFTADSTVPF